MKIVVERAANWAEYLDVNASKHSSAFKCRCLYVFFSSSKKEGVNSCMFASYMMGPASPLSSRFLAIIVTAFNAASLVNSLASLFLNRPIIPVIYSAGK